MSSASQSSRVTGWWTDAIIAAVTPASQIWRVLPGFHSCQVRRGPKLGRVCVCVWLLITLTLSILLLPPLRKRLNSDVAPAALNILLKRLGILILADHKTNYKSVYCSVKSPVSVFFRDDSSSTAQLLPHRVSTVDGQMELQR